MSSVHINAQIPVLTAEETKEFAEKSTSLTIELLRGVTENRPDKNIVFCSFSIQTCLGVIQLGAYKNTSTDLQRLLPSHSVFKKTFDTLIYTNNKLLTTASHFFYNPGSNVLPSFSGPAAQYFRSTSSQVRIAHTSGVTIRLTWWSKEEGRSIPDSSTFFTVNSVKHIIEKRRLVFGNLMNFKNEWRKKFSKARTHLDTFYMSSEKYTQVPMMTQVGLFLYAYIPNLNATALTLHYRHYDMSMLILLPDTDSDIYQLQKVLTYDALKEVRSLECYQRVEVELPKFNITNSIYYTDTLTKMGLEGIFSTNMRILGNSEILRVDNLVQYNTFILNEEGANQEDVGATKTNDEITLKFNTREFYAYRPFIFFIQNAAGHTFYAGKVNKF